MDFTLDGIFTRQALTCLGLSALTGFLPAALGSGARVLRYFLLVLVAVWGVPGLLKVWLKPISG